MRHFRRSSRETGPAQACRGSTRQRSAQLRRQPGFGRIAPAGSSRDERLDPFRLPVRFAVDDNSADWGLRTVELASERVVLRRSLRGMKMTISLPISNYLGIALQINRPASPNAAVELALEHSDRAFSVPLCRADHACDVVADWQSLSSVLGIPSLLVEADGRPALGIRARRRVARRVSHLAPPPPVRDQGAKAADPAAAQARTANRRGDHAQRQRAVMAANRWARPRPAPGRRIESVRRRDSI